MKKLQNNFTTPEQSNRLLELGVPADSADLIQVQDAITTDEYIMVRNEDEPIGEFIENNQDILPCWSVGRLREIFYYSADDKEHVKEVLHELPNCSIETLINIITVFVKQYNELDFSKLEEL